MKTKFEKHLISVITKKGVSRTEKKSAIKKLFEIQNKKK
jgi:hypothetical protein